MALILVLESSTEVCSVALFRDGVLIEERENKDGMNHANLLTVFIDEIMEAQDLMPSDLDALAVASGPGSYTGLRIGVSAAKGICYGADIPLIAISSLEAMAYHVANHRERYNIPNDGSTFYCPMIDARRMEVFTAFFDQKGAQIREIGADIIDENSYSDFLGQSKVVFFGNGAHKCIDTLTHPNAIFVKDVIASASHMGYLAEKAFSEKKFEDVAYFEPFYLKDFIATVPKKNILGNLGETSK